jgi:hypothetical protein
MVIRLTLKRSAATFWVTSSRLASSPGLALNESVSPAINRSTVPRSASDNDVSVLSTVSRIALLVVFMFAVRLRSEFASEERIPVGQTADLLFRKTLVPEAGNWDEHPASHEPVDRGPRYSQEQSCFGNRVGQFFAKRRRYLTNVIDDDGTGEFIGFHARIIARPSDAK